MRLALSRSRRVALSALVVLAILSLSCQTASPSASPFDTVRAGGTLRVGLVHFWENYMRGEAPGPVFDQGLDPHQAIGQQAELFRCCLVRTLLSYSGQPTADGGTQLRPDLATDLPEVSDDGLTWTFHLKSGLRYGPPLEDTEIVAGDIVRAIERSLTPTPPDLAQLPFANPRIGAAYYVYEELIAGARALSSGTASSIAGLEAPDRYTLVVRATSATGDVPYLFALADSAPIPPNPADRLARLGVAQGHEGGYGPYLVSSGPYMLEGAEDLDFSLPAEEQLPASGYRSGESYTLVRNPSWDRSTDDLRPAYLDRIEFTLASSEDAALAAVEAGELDIGWDVIPTADQVADYFADEALRQRLIAEPNDVVFLVAMNVATPPFDDLHVRTALNLVVDKGAIQGLAASSPPRFAGPTGGHVASHAAPDGLEDDLLVGYRPYDAGDDHGDLAAAKAEMALSAYDTDGDGVCDAAECRDILALVRDDEPFWAGMAEIMSEGAAELGIGFGRQVVPVQEMFGRGLDPAARVPISFGIRFNKDYPTAAGFIPGLFSGEALTGGGAPSLLGATPAQLAEWGYSVASVPSIDDRIAACRAEIREPVECWARLDQYLMEEIAPAVPLLFGEAAWIVSERVSETSFAQATIWPALDRFVLAAESR
jgi:peptide/nickel transport system substrate-binding protein